MSVLISMMALSIMSCSCTKPQKYRMSWNLQFHSHPVARTGDVDDPNTYISPSGPGTHIFSLSSLVRGTLSTGILVRKVLHFAMSA